MKLGFGDLVRLGIASRRWVLFGAITSAVGTADWTLRPLWESLFRGPGTIDAMRAIGDDVWPKIEMAKSWFAGFGALDATLIALGAVAALPALLVASATFTYYGFTLWSEGERYRTRRGLFTQKAVSVAASRLQHVTIRQNPVMRIMKRYALSSPAAQGSTIASYALASGADSLDVPLMTDEQAGDLAHRVLGPKGEGLPLLPAQTGFTRVSRLYVRAVFLRSFYKPVLFPFLGFLLYVYPGAMKPALIVFLVWVLLRIPASWVTWRNRGYAIGDGALVSREGFLQRRTMAFIPNKAQSVEVSRSPLELRRDLATLSVALASGDEFVIPFIDHDLARQLRDRIISDIGTGESQWY